MSPAGHWPQLRAAVEAGADAVYFGLRHFSARGKVGFGLDELPEAIATLHGRGRAGLRHLQHAGVRPRAGRGRAGPRRDRGGGRRRGHRPGRRRGAAGADRGAGPGRARLHPDVGDQRPGRGFARRTAAAGSCSGASCRSPTCAGSAAATDVELEVFVHGALCVSYSGQCFSSEAWGGRSANRGQCAQACRSPTTWWSTGAARPARRALPALARRPDGAGAGAGARRHRHRLLQDRGPLQGRRLRGADDRRLPQAIDDAWAAASAARPAPAPDPALLRDLEQVYSRGLGPWFIAGRRSPDRRARARHATGGCGWGRSCASRAPAPRRAAAGRRGGPQGGAAGQVGAVVAPPAADERPTGAGGPSPGARAAEAAGRAPPSRRRPGVRRRPPPLARPARAGRPRLRRRGRPRRLAARRSDAATWTAPPASRATRSGAPTTPPCTPASGIGPRRASRGAPMASRSPSPPTRARPWSSSPPASAARAPSPSATSRSPTPTRAPSTWPRPGPSSDASAAPPSISSTSRSTSRAPPSYRSRCSTPAAASWWSSSSPRGGGAGSAGRRSSLLRRRRKRASRRSAPRRPSPSPDAPARLHVLVRTPEQLEAALAAHAAGTTLESVTLDYLELYGLRPSVERVRAAGVRVRVASPRVLKPAEQNVVRFLLDLGAELLVRSAGLLRDLVAEPVERRPRLTGDFSLNAANALTAHAFLEPAATPSRRPTTSTPSRWPRSPPPSTRAGSRSSSTTTCRSSTPSTACSAASSRRPRPHRLRAPLRAAPAGAARSAGSSCTRCWPTWAAATPSSAPRRRARHGTGALAGRGAARRAGRVRARRPRRGRRGAGRLARALDGAIAPAALEARLRAAVPPGLTEGSYFVPRAGMRELPLL
jgi:U32 family peptidase